MAREVGDLWPQASGSASLGAEMMNGGFTGNVRPFAQVHLNSGVWHNINGQSGIITFLFGDDQSIFFQNRGRPNRFAVSTDGGTLFPLEFGAYDRTPGFACAYIGTPNNDLEVRSSGQLDFISSLQSTYLGFEGITIRSVGPSLDGAVQLVSDFDDIALLANNGNISLSSDSAQQTSATDIVCTAGQNVSITATNGTVTIDAAAGDIALTANGPAGNMSIYGRFDVSILGDDDITINNAANGNNITALAGTQVDIRAFALSGALNYQFGPYQSWYIKTSHASTGGPFNDGYWPIAHSGNVNEMITLQRAYNNGRTAHLNSTVGNMEIVSNTAKLKLAGTTQAEINVSGVYTRPSLSHEMGDVWMLAHSAMDALGANTTATSQAEATAKAIGHGSLVYNTGSGTISLAVASGVAQFLNTSTMSVTTATQTLPLVAAYQAADRNYGIGSVAAGTSGQVTIFSPGLYKATYKVLANKTVGTTPQTVQTNALLNGSNILGSFVNSFHYDSSTASQNSTGCTVVFNANAGDVFRLDTSSTLAGADNCSVGVRGALLVIEKLGPKRGTF